MAAVDATDWAIDGTVNCAKRDDGRPAFAGTAAATGAAAAFSTVAGEVEGDFDLEETVVCIDLADVLETGMGAGLATARGLEIAGFESDGVAFLAGTVLGGAAVLAVGLAFVFGATFATGLVVFATGLGATLTTPLLAATDFATGLATGFPLGLATTVALVLAATALVSFPDLAFTSCLLAEIFCAWSMGPANPVVPLTVFSDWGSPAGECTGLPLAKPIRCKIETII